MQNLKKLFTLLVLMSSCIILAGEPLYLDEGTHLEPQEVARETIDNLFSYNMDQHDRLKVGREQGLLCCSFSEFVADLETKDDDDDNDGKDGKDLAEHINSPFMYRYYHAQFNRLLENKLGHYLIPKPDGLIDVYHALMACDQAWNSLKEKARRDLRNKDTGPSLLPCREKDFFYCKQNGCFYAPIDENHILQIREFNMQTKKDTCLHQIGYNKHREFTLFPSPEGTNMIVLDRDLSSGKSLLTLINLETRTSVNIKDKLQNDTFMHAQNIKYTKYNQFTFTAEPLSSRSPSSHPSWKYCTYTYNIDQNGNILEPTTRLSNLR